MKNIFFYNYWHNGDIHSSREFVKDIMNKISANYYYYHNNSEKLLDINIQINKYLNPEKPDNNKLFYTIDNDIYINTWFHLNYGHKIYQCTIEALYYNFNIIYKELGIDIEPIEFYIPNINYENYDIKNINLYFKNNNKYDKYVFISNGNVQSGQSINDNMDNIINILSDKFSNYLFILSNNTSLQKHNIILSKDIIKIDENSDLCENSYITTLCDYIIGRESGPFFYGYVKDNVMGDKLQTIISICHIKPFLDIKYYSNSKTFIHLNNITQLIEKIN
jgi:hypothetical protein